MKGVSEFFFLKSLNITNAEQFVNKHLLRLFGNVDLTSTKFINYEFFQPADGTEFHRHEVILKFSYKIKIADGLNIPEPYSFQNSDFKKPNYLLVKLLLSSSSRNKKIKLSSSSYRDVLYIYSLVIMVNDNDWDNFYSKFPKLKEDEIGWDGYDFAEQHYGVNISELPDEVITELKGFIEIAEVNVYKKAERFFFKQKAISDANDIRIEREFDAHINSLPIKDLDAPFCEACQSSPCECSDPDPT